MTRPGPFIGGIAYRDKAASPVFPYSEAFRRLEGIWTPAELNARLARPTGFVPGTRMWYAGVDDPQERADIIAYLATTRAQ